jgi:hypothetical protein
MASVEAHPRRYKSPNTATQRRGYINKLSGTSDACYNTSCSQRYGC